MVLTASAQLIGLLAEGQLSPQVVARVSQRERIDEPNSIDEVINRAVGVFHLRQLVSP